MHKAICLTLLIIFSFASSAQVNNDQDRKISFTAELNGSFTGAACDGSDPFLLSALFGINYKKHCFYLGPNMDSNGHIYGGTFTYLTFPNGIGKRIDFFFQFDLIYQTNKYTDNYYLSSSTVKENRISNFYGYGFHLNFSKNVFFSSNFGIGLIWIDKKANPDLTHYSGDLPGLHAGLEIGFAIGVNFNRK